MSFSLRGVFFSSSVVFTASCLFCAISFFPASAVVAQDENEGDEGGGNEGHEGEIEQARSAKLTPPEGAPFPDARGEVVLNRELFRVEVEGLAPGDYKVLLDDGKGTKTDIGTITVKTED